MDKRLKITDGGYNWSKSKVKAASFDNVLHVKSVFTILSLSIVAVRTTNRQDLKLTNIAILDYATTGYNIGGTRITNLCYADDIALVANSL